MSRKILALRTITVCNNEEIACYKLQHYLNGGQYAVDYADNSLFQFVAPDRNGKVATGVSPLMRRESVGGETSPDTCTVRRGGARRPESSDLMDDEHRAGGVADGPFGYAAHQQTAQTLAAVRAHNDQ